MADITNQALTAAIALLEDPNVGWNAVFPIIANSHGIDNQVLNFSTEPYNGFQGWFQYANLLGSDAIQSAPAGSTGIGMIMAVSIAAADDNDILKQYNSTFNGIVTLNIETWVTSISGGYPGSAFETTANAITDTLFNIFSGANDGFLRSGYNIGLMRSSKRCARAPVDQTGENWAQRITHLIPLEVFI